MGQCRVSVRAFERKLPNFYDLCGVHNSEVINMLDCQFKVGGSNVCHSRNFFEVLA